MALARQVLDQRVREMTPALSELGLLRDSLDGKRLDAGETLFFTRQLEHVKAELVEQEFEELLARTLFPLENGVDPGAETFIWREYTRSGLAKIIANYATDIPDVEEQGKENTSKIESIGIGFSYSVQDVRRSAKAGYPLQSRKAIMAREEAERKIDEVCALGTASRGITGMLNSSAIPILSAGVKGNWLSTATAQDMLDDLRLLESTIMVSTRKRHRPNTLALGLQQYAKITSTSISIYEPSVTVYEAFLRSSTSIRQIEAWGYCDGAAANGTDTRALAYEKNQLNSTICIPLDYESLPPQAIGATFSVPGYARCGGGIIYKPLAHLYCDTLS